MLNIARVKQLKILGVTISDDLRFDGYISATLSLCEQSLYALRVMKTHGMPVQALQTVFASVTLSKLMYCSSVWSGFLRADDINRINSFLSRCVKYGYRAADSLTFNQLCAKADNTSFKSILSNPNHVLRRLLPPERDYTYNLRPRRHDRVQIEQATCLGGKNFVARMLRNNRYVP